MQMIQLAAGLFVLFGAVNTGVLTNGDGAILFDCCDSVTEERLAEIGVKHVDMILCTQHRRVNVTGAYPFVEKGAELCVPGKERDLFDNTAAYWSEWKNRWHMYHSQPGPQVLASPLPVSRSVGEGDVIEWHGYNIRVLDTPGATMGAVSYVVEADDKTYCFSGDVLYGPGQVWDLYSLQKGYKFGMGDYHGFLGNLRLLKPSLGKLVSSGADALIPSHGHVIENPEEAADLTVRRLDEAWNSYSAVSSLRYWFPPMMEEGSDDPRRMPFAWRGPNLDFVRHISETTYVLISESGAAFVMDCGNDHVVDELRKMSGGGIITAVEGAWITHYHDDHVDGIGRLYNAFRCPVIADEHVAEVVAHPRRFHLPCISHAAVPVTRVTKNGESWQWREFTLTAYHFPGQTLHHGALLAEGRGKRILFTGDSFSPAGIDDYCPGNRNFLGENRGYHTCLETVRRLKPDLIINSHMDFTMMLTDSEIDHMERVLKEREEIFAGLLPWDDPNFGTDVSWVRTYPYEQDAFAGSACTFETRFTNHGGQRATARAEAVLPEGWRIDRAQGGSETTISPLSEGAFILTAEVPADAAPGQYIIPVRITWNGKYLGQMRHTVIRVMR